MRIGFRTRLLTLVIYLRRGFSIEAWLGKAGFYTGPSGRTFYGDRIEYGPRQWRCGWGAIR